MSLGTDRAALWVLAAIALTCACSSGDQSGDEGRGKQPGVAGTNGAPIEEHSGAAGSFGEQPKARPMTRTPMGQAGSASMGEECAAITKMAEAKLGPVDIVWIVDGSPSMLDETLAVQENITNFANAISMAGIDHHVVMLATGDIAAGTPLGMDTEHYLFVPALVGSNDALQQLLDLYPAYMSFLRPEAALHFIAVTDDESFVTAADFQTQMEMIAGKKFIFHAIASESVDGLPCSGACGLPIICGAARPGVQYYALADTTGGRKISICTADWSMVFGPLKEAVIESAPLPCDYPLPPPPDGEKLDFDKVNLEFIAPAASDAEVFPRANDEASCADNLAWYYDDPTMPTAIEMCPAACTAIGGGGTVQIKLGCETVPLVVK